MGPGDGARLGASVGDWEGSDRNEIQKSFDGIGTMAGKVCSRSTHSGDSHRLFITTQWQLTRVGALVGDRDGDWKEESQWMHGINKQSRITSLDGHELHPSQDRLSPGWELESATGMATEGEERSASLMNESGSTPRIVITFNMPMYQFE